jgi:hypothetical protein
MHDHHHGTPSGDRTPTPFESLDPTEATRRALYDAVVKVHFQPGPEEVQRAQEDPENFWVPTYTPDQAGLAILWIFGRWFVVWRALEVTEGPEALKWTVLRIVPDPEGSPVPLQFLEV